MLGAIPIIRPNFAAATFRFDQVELVSAQSVGHIRSKLPLADLERLAPSFRVLSTTGDAGRYGWRSRICFTAPAAIEFWNILLEHRAVYDAHLLRQVEIAFDFYAGRTVPEAEALLRWIATHIRKPWHKSRTLDVKEQHEAPWPGYVTLPRIWFEGSNSQTKLRVYARRAKREQSRQRGFFVRVEFILTGSRNIASKFGLASGQTDIADLLGFDVTAFREKFLRFEEIDFRRFGSWAKGLPLAYPISVHAPAGVDADFLAGTTYLGARVIKSMFDGESPTVALLREWSVSSLRGHLSQAWRGARRSRNLDRFFPPADLKVGEKPNPLIHKANSNPEIPATGHPAPDTPVKGNTGSGNS